MSSGPLPGIRIHFRAEARADVRSFASTADLDKLQAAAAGNGKLAGCKRAGLPACVMQ